MRIFETQATVTESGEMTIRLVLPEKAIPGQHRVVVVMEEPSPQAGAVPPLNLPLLPVESWPEDLSLRREDLYGDWGR